jgi:hypothetical protein
MNVQRVRAAIEQMEAWLADPNWQPEPGALAQWNTEFQGALARAEKGPGWSDLISRAQAAGQLLEARSAVLAETRDRLRAELEAQERGTRALKGYGAGTL